MNIRRKREARRRAIRNALIAGLLLFISVMCMFLGYTFLSMPEQIAANTGDSVRLIQTIGFWAYVTAFCCFVGVPMLYIFDLAD
jgi:amino acid permease